MFKQESSAAKASPSRKSQSPEAKRRKSEIDRQATSMVFKVEYEQMEPVDKLDYLKVQI